MLCNLEYVTVYIFLFLGVEYVLAAEGKLCTENGDFAIDDLTICKKAAAKLDYTFQQTLDSNIFLKGCLVVSNGVYFNVHEHGSKKADVSDERQICKAMNSESRSFLTSMDLLV